MIVPTLCGQRIDLTDAHLTITLHKGGTYLVEASSLDSEIYYPLGVMKSITEAHSFIDALLARSERRGQTVSTLDEVA